MPAVKNQHYVPQFYFRLFSTDGKMIEVYNLKRSAGFTSPIRHVCSKPYYYSKNAEMEKILAQLENRQADVIRSVISNKTLRIPLQDGHMLLSFMALQYSRTPVAKRKDQQSMEIISDKIVSSLLGPNADCKIVDPDIHVRAIKNALNFFPLLFDLTPVLLINNTSSDYICSDNPVVFHNTYFNRPKDWGVLGLQSPGLQIFCPLNAKLLLMLFDPECYSTNTPDKDCTLPINSQNDIESLNSLQIINSDESIFYSDKSQEQKIKIIHDRVRHLIGKNRMLTDTISVRDGNREREFLHTYEYREPYDLNLSFLRPNDKVDTTKMVRNREFCELVRRYVENSDKDYEAKFIDGNLQKKSN